MKRIVLSRPLMAGAALSAIVFAFALAATPAAAHNAGHIILPDGSCQDAGSGNIAPNPNVDKYKEVPDLHPESDQYGARYAADRGSTPIEPRWCAEVGLIPRN